MKLERGDILCAGACLILACGSGGPHTGGEGNAGGGGQGGSSGFPSGVGGTHIFTNAGSENGGSGGAAAEEQNLVAFRVEPEAAVLEVAPGESRELVYRAFGRFETAPDVEVELTDRTVFYVPDNYLVASFPADGSGTLTTRVPGAAGEPEQRGGTLTVEARAANSDGSISTATTSLTVRLAGSVSPAAGSPGASPALPVDPSQHFSGEADPARAPLLVYPNDGVLMPPNLGRLEIHFERGAPENILFEVRFASALGDLRYFTRCHSDPTEFVDGACALMIEGSDLRSLSSTHRGQGPITLTVRGSDEDGRFGESASVEIEFAAERIDGAVYYWTATSPASIVRFDFGSDESVPETFVAPASVPGNDGSCVGCHALSRQGDKMFFSLGNSARGELMYVSDMSLALDAPDFFTYNGAELDQELDVSERQNRVLTGSFNPSGSQFVAVAPVNDPAADQRLWFHDGETGERVSHVTLPFIPSHPDWSPLGDSIAVTAIQGTNAQTISFLGAGIQLVQQTAGVWNGDEPLSIVPPAAGKNRFNPTFLPDASLLLYSEVDQGSYSGSHDDACVASDVTGDGRFCNGYSDPGAKTWAVAPAAGATPVLLAEAASPGVADERFPPPQSGVSPGDLMDTFPKPAPFLTSHRGRTIGWFTVSSQRRAGLRRFFANPSVVGDPATQALLWMFAIDPGRVLEAQDGSRPGFFLPFQDLTTSNHMAQWTERIVSDDPPPPAPPAPPPPAPPPAPPPPILH